MTFICRYPSPVGELLLISKDDALTGLYFKSDANFLKRFGDYIIDENNNILKEAKKWLDEYFAGNIPSIKLPLKTSGTPFQEMVWELLAQIPYGKVTTYLEIANIIAKKRELKRMSAQAVGGAVGSNPISIIIPCHRVVSTNNNLTGFGGGIENKVKLLTIEGHDLTQFKMPK